jgi:hypothetical protein
LPEQERRQTSLLLKSATLSSVHISANANEMIDATLNKKSAI